MHMHMRMCMDMCMCSCMCMCTHVLTSLLYASQEILTLTKEQFHQAWGLALVVWTPVQF